MKKTLKDKLSDKLVNAFLKNKIISAIPKNLQKNLLKQINLENYAKAKLKNLLLVTKLEEQEFLF